MPQKVSYKSKMFPPSINNKLFPPGRLEPFTMGKNLVSHFRSQLPVLLADLEIQAATVVRRYPIVTIT